MKAKYILPVLLLAFGMDTAAQFVVEKHDGTKKEISKKMSILTYGTVSGWTFGGIPLHDINTISTTKLADRLDSYVAPEYPDYYRSISGWADRSKWNLANVHDPSVVLAADGYYYMFTTDASFGNAHSGHGHFMCRRSKNLVDWEFMGATMSKLPAWVKTKLNEIRAEMGLGESTADFTNDNLFGFWAPCVRYVDGIYRMYYAITCPGYINGDNTWGERAFIGLMETRDISDTGSWEDKGYVVTNASDRQLNFNVKPDDWANCYFKWNAIDPSYIVTPDGAHWLIYGSWHSGFAAIELDTATGKPKTEPGMPWGDSLKDYGTLVNTRQMGNRWQASEAPEVVYHNGYYYLFMAYDELAVAYNTRVVRSKNINGPYYGIDGTNVSQNGGNAFPIVTHPYKFAEHTGWVGISHCAVFQDRNGHWFYSSQGRLPAGAYGDDYSNAIMQGQVRRIVWTADGWPLVMPECYGAVPQQPITEAELAGAWQAIQVEYAYQKQCEPDLLKLNADHTATGCGFGNATWSFDTAANVLTVGGQKLYVCREADWESSPRRATIVFAGYSANGKKTYWGKRSADSVTVGNAANTSAFWTDFSPYLTSKTANCTFHFSFKNYTNKADNWNNWILVLTNGRPRHATDYVEYAVIRADHYGWGTYCTDAQRTAGMTSNYNWDTFKADMDGAQVELTAAIAGGKLTMTAATTAVTGTDYSYKYTVSGLPSTAKGAFLTTEKGHLVIDLTKTE